MLEYGKLDQMQNKNQSPQKTPATLPETHPMLLPPSHAQSLPESELIINKLTEKIDRRLNIGYYCQVPAVRKIAKPQPRRKPTQPRPPKSHPIIKKPKKQAIVIQTTEQGQNTSQLQMVAYGQNTSLQMIPFVADAEVQDGEMQWSCEQTEIEQRNMSMQWSIEQPELINQDVQYTLEEDMVEMRDASIQCEQSESQSEDFEPMAPPTTPVTIPEPQPTVQEVIPLIQTNQASIQCDPSPKPQISSFSIQFDTPKPLTQSLPIQIDLPDQAQIRQIQKMQGKVSYLKLQQAKQLKMQKKAQQKIQLLKLQQTMGQLEGQIKLAESKESFAEQKLQRQLEIAQRQQQMRKQQNQLEGKFKQHYTNKMNEMLSQIATPQTPQPRHIIGKSQQQERQEQLKRQEMEAAQSRGEMQQFRNQIGQLKQELKQEMKRQLHVQSDGEETTQLSNSRARRNSDFLRSSRVAAGSNMSVLFPAGTVHRQFVGAIVKNSNFGKVSNPQQAEQTLLNKHFTSARLSKAYWRQKSSFDYKFESDNQRRLLRKEKYMAKMSELEVKNNDEGCSSVQLNQIYTPFKGGMSRNKFELSRVQSSKAEIPQKYKKRQIRFSLAEVMRIKKDLDEFYAGDYFKYLYSEAHRIETAHRLFAIFTIVPASHCTAEILPCSHSLVLQLRSDILHFIVISHSHPAIFYSSCPLTHQLSYASSQNYKNWEGFEYRGKSQEIYAGGYSHGEHEGYGLQLSRDIYEGQFVNSKREGKGKLVLQNGDTYTGNFKNGFFNGEGLYRWASGQSYDGFFERGLKQGFGRHRLANGDSYEGMHSNNKREGDGTYTWKSGAVFSGRFQADRRCGTGKMAQENGELVCVWKEDSWAHGLPERANRGEKAQELPLRIRKAKR